VYIFQIKRIPIIWMWKDILFWNY